MVQLQFDPVARLDSERVVLSCVFHDRQDVRRSPPGRRVHSGGCHQGELAAVNGEPSDQQHLLRNGTCRFLVLPDIRTFGHRPGSGSTPLGSHRVSPSNRQSMMRPSGRPSTIAGSTDSTSVPLTNVKPAGGSGRTTRPRPPGLRGPRGRSRSRASRGLKSMAMPGSHSRRHGGIRFGRVYRIGCEKGFSAPFRREAQLDWLRGSLSRFAVKTMGGICLISWLTGR